MKNNKKFDLVHYISVLSFSLLILSVSAQITHPSDVAGIKLLLSMFPELDELQDDPCFPTPYPWVACSSDDTPRITALNCGNRKPKLFGTLPEFTSMDALEIIDFENNFLFGEFPDFLAGFSKLKALNLADNTFYGTVPTSLRDKWEANTLTLTLPWEKMPLLLCFSDEDTCTNRPATSPGLTTGLTPPPRSTDSSEKPLSLGARIAIRFAIGIGVIVVFVVICLFIVRIIGQCQNKNAPAASGPVDEISGLAMPVNAETEQQQMHRPVQRVQA